MKNKHQFSNFLNISQQFNLKRKKNQFIARNRWYEILKNDTPIAIFVIVERNLIFNTFSGLLHYSLCPPEELLPIYEVFVMSCSLQSLVSSNTLDSC